jgi:predicted CoA-binding protein
MVSRATIDDFLAQKTLALAGVSRDGKAGFGNAVRKELAAKGYTLLLVHPEADAIDGVPCVHAVKDVAERAGGLVLTTPPAVTATLVREAAEAGINRVWIQQGAESDAAVQFCETHGMKVVHHQCILMFSEPAGFPHRFHRGVLRLFRRLPA